MSKLHKTRSTNGRNNWRRHIDCYSHLTFGSIVNYNVCFHGLSFVIPYDPCKNYNFPVYDPPETTDFYQAGCYIIVPHDKMFTNLHLKYKKIKPLKLHGRLPKIR